MRLIEVEVEDGGKKIDLVKEAEVCGVGMFLSQNFSRGRRLVPFTGGAGEGLEEANLKGASEFIDNGFGISGQLE